VKLQQLKQKACTAFAQYHAARHDPTFGPVGLEVIEEISALGGYAGGTITLTSKKHGSPRSGEVISETGSSAGNSPHDASSTSNSPDHLHETTQSFSQPFLPNTTSYGQPYPVGSPKFQGNSAQVQVPSQGTVLPNDFNDIFGVVGDQGRSVLSGTDILEQLGLMEEWQPNMDYMGF
jgi:hypothetical protein